MSNSIPRRRRERCAARTPDRVRLGDSLPPDHICLSTCRPSSAASLDMKTELMQSRHDALLLEDLEAQVMPAATLTAVATDDALFLAQEPIDLRRKSIRDASHILDVSTLVIARLQHVRETQLHSFKFGHRVACEKQLANLEHLLRCLQQAAIEALAFHSWEQLQYDHAYWNQYLEQRRRNEGACESEWEGGQPPLNSTMPWNIKPSLVVLWGVCWMFYEHLNSNRVSPENGRMRRDSEPWPARQAQQAQQQSTSWPQGYSTYQSPTRRASTQTRHSLSAASGQQATSVAMGVGLGLQNVAESYDGRSSDAMTQGMFQSGHAPQTGDFLRNAGPQAAATFPPPTIPAKGMSYLRTTNLTPASTSDPSLSVASPAWTHDPVSTAPYSTAQPSWGPSPVQNTTTFTYPTATPGSSHVASFDVPATAASSASHYSRGFATPGSYPTQYFGGIHVQMQDQQQPPYPSPHSEGTREPSVLPVNLPNSISPQIPPATSPSGSHMSGSASGTSREPPRNELGQIYCDYEECASNPPTFTRKCEWSKHMDKHTRPHICRQPGCEKIRGFTYSGGLLRHMREVHRKYGGPKAPRFCPHPDCKRSTGQGFSRKENLHEHLRRVHRGVGIEEDGTDVVSSTTPPAVAAPRTASEAAPVAPDSASRKRKRSGADGDDDAEAAAMAQLREENARLRHELAACQERLKTYEELVLRSMQPSMPMGTTTRL